MRIIFVAFYIFFLMVLVQNKGNVMIVDTDNETYQMYELSPFVERANSVYVMEEIVKFENRRKIR